MNTTPIFAVNTLNQLVITVNAANLVPLAMFGLGSCLLLFALYEYGSNEEPQYKSNNYNNNNDSDSDSSDNDSDDDDDDNGDNNELDDDLLLIGVTGRKKSGKDTIGKYLINEHGFVRVAFADSLKKACKEIFGLTNKQLYDDQIKEIVDRYWKHSPREILQNVGTELFRIELPKLCKFIDDDIWIRSVDRKIRKLRKRGYTKIVVTDVRFDNELDYIKKMKGYTWKVSRPSLLKDVDPNIPVHASEALIDGFVCDTHYENERTINELYDDVETQIDTILTPTIEPTIEPTVCTDNVLDNDDDCATRNILFM